MRSDNQVDTWYTKSLGDGMTASLPADEIKVSFMRLFRAQESPPDMAIFTRLEPKEGHLHCEVMAYFTPATRDVAEAFDAKPCVKPSHSGLDLLAGDEKSWALLFPEK